MNWIENKVAEARLGHLGLSYRLEDVPLAGVEGDASCPAAGGDEEHVVLMALQMESGSNFPAVVLYRPEGGGPLRVLDGRHRLAAFRRAFPHGDFVVHAYVVDEPDADLLKSVVFWLNH